MSVLMPATIWKQNILPTYFLLCVYQLWTDGSVWYIQFPAWIACSDRNTPLTPLRVWMKWDSAMRGDSGSVAVWLEELLEWEDLGPSASLAAPGADCCILPGWGKHMAQFANHSGHHRKEIYLDGKSMF